MSAMFASSADAEARRKADRLAAALAGMALPGRVEPRATLAVLVVDAATMNRLAEREVRAAALAMAREHGFTHLAVELATDPGPDAPLLRH